MNVRLNREKTNGVQRQTSHHLPHLRAQATAQSKASGKGLQNHSQKHVSASSCGRTLSPCKVVLDKKTQGIVLHILSTTTLQGLSVLPELPPTISLCLCLSLCVSVSLSVHVDFTCTVYGCMWRPEDWLVFLRCCLLYVFETVSYQRGSHQAGLSWLVNGCQESLYLCLLSAGTTNVYHLPGFLNMGSGD